MDYPAGPPDTMEIACGADWSPVPLRGSWFIDAFEGPMSNLQRVVSGEDTILVGSVDDAIKTMALVEACYTSSQQGGTPILATTAVLPDAIDTVWRWVDAVGCRACPS